MGFIHGIKISAAWAVDREFFIYFGLLGLPLPSFVVPLGSLGCPIGLLWDPLGLPWDALGLLLGALGLLWGALGLPWDALGPLLGALGCPWGSRGGLRKKMWLKYRACAQDLASGNLPGGPGGPGETVS